MTQTRLAELAKLGRSTVVDYEKMRRQVSVVAIETIRNALRRAGSNSSTRTAVAQGFGCESGSRSKTQSPVSNAKGPLAREACAGYLTCVLLYDASTRLWRLPKN
jgi:transcriptional regulator with XRE-family HTH domain